MATVAYTSRIRIERRKGPVRIAYLPGEAQPVTFSVHGAIAEHCILGLPCCSHQLGA